MISWPIGLVSFPVRSPACMLQKGCVGACKKHVVVNKQNNSWKGGGLSTLVIYHVFNIVLCTINKLPLWNHNMVVYD